MATTTIIKPDGSTFELLSRRIFGPDLLFVVQEEGAVYFGRCFDRETNSLLISASLGKGDIPENKEPCLHLFHHIEFLLQILIT